MKAFRLVVGPGARCVMAVWIVVGFAFSAQAAEYYKWVDQNGVTHYSDAPPPDNIQAQKIGTSGIRDTNAAGTADANADADAQNKADAPDPAKLAAAKTAFCDDVHARLGVLNSGHQTVEFDADGTHTHPMSPEQAAALRADLEAKQHQFCEPKAAPPAENADKNS